jgi:tRNA modification GTPase
MEAFFMEDTICAISTSLGIGAISIVRVSGSNAVSIVNKICDKDLTKVKSHTITYAHITNKDKVIDEVLIMTMLAPKTYTKEDIIEINCHGGENTTKTVLSLLLSNGCRMSEPGEFTKRAFLNGRIDLTQAEAVNDLIMAKTDASRTLAINQVNGLINKEINDLRDTMSKILANIEVNIDYPEYTDEIEITNNLLNTNVNKMLKKLEKIIKDSESGRIISNGINIAIIGKPNVGKSSLLNTFLDEEKAIVTSVAGTTRDIVEGSISLNGVLVNFIDTAGIHHTDDIVEKLGVDKSLKAIDTADLIILVLNNNEPLTNEDQELLNKVDKNKTIIFVNKNDLKTMLNISEKYQVVYGNTLSLDGISTLKESIIEHFSLDTIINKDMTYLSNIRQIDLVKKAYNSLKNVEEGIKNDTPIDLLSIDIKNAWNYLGEVTGSRYADELVDQIFSNFCLGK